MSILAGIFLIALLYSIFHKPKPLPANVEDTVKYWEQKKRGDSLQAAYNRGRDSLNMMAGQIEYLESQRNNLQNQNSNYENKIIQLTNRTAPLPNYSSNDVSTWANGRFGDIAP